jgi:hypothetical protein
VIERVPLIIAPTTSGVRRAAAESCSTRWHCAPEQPARRLLHQLVSRCGRRRQ